MNAGELAAGMPPWLAESLGWIQTHPVESMLILALATAVEGLFLIGMLIPGSALMIFAGALAVASDIPLMPVMLAAAIGAWLGDCLSFWLGWRYRDQLQAIATRLRMPGAISRGQRFFARHGGKSILLGRFIGPLRPLVPAIAGAAAMPWWQFALIDLVAAMLWAPAYALPGVLVGATISLAAEITTRLAVLAGLLFVLAWLIWWLVTLAVRSLQNHAEPLLLRLMDWSHKHRRLGNLGPALADPHQPETPILLVCLILLSSLIGLLGHLWWNWPAQLIPPALDALAYDTLAALLSPAIMPLARAAAHIGNLEVSALMGLGMLLLFASQRQNRMMAHWIAGLLGGSLIGLALPGGGLAISPIALLDSTSATAASLSVWFCFAGLLASRHNSAVRITLYSSVGLIVGIMLLARLMLGMISGSQLILALSGVLIWCSLLTLGYRRHLRRPQIPALAPSAGLALLLLSLGLSLHDPPAESPAGGWAQTDAAAARLNLFWQGELNSIDASLHAAGWRRLEPPGRREYINWLIADADQRPPAPKWLGGRSPDLRYLRDLANGEQLILRLWRDIPGQYAGQIGRLSLRKWAGLMHVPVTDADSRALAALEDDLRAHWQLVRGRETSPLFIFPAQSPSP